MQRTIPRLLPMLALVVLVGLARDRLFVFAPESHRTLVLALDGRWTPSLRRRAAGE